MNGEMTMTMAKAMPGLAANKPDPAGSFPVSSVAGGKLAVCAADNLSLFGEGTNGRGVLLLHGVTGSPIEMKYIAKWLHRAGCSVYAPLLPGHGKTMDDLRKTTWKDWSKGVSEAANWFAPKCDDLYVAGICGGGLLGLRLAHSMPAIRAAAVYSPLLRYDGWNAPLHYRYGHYAVPVAVKLGVARYIAVKERYPFGIKSDRIRRLLAETGEGIRGTLPAFPVETLHQTYRMFRWIRKTLPRMTTPSLVIHSKQDDLAAPQNAQYICDHIGGSCEIKWLDNSYHMIHVDQEHKSVAEITRAYFERASQS